jgi:spore germination protein KB
MLTMRQAQTLLFMFILGTAILVIPSMTAAYSKQDAWLAVLLAGLIGLVSLWLVVSVCQRVGNRTIVEAGLVVLGPVFGTLLGLGYVLFAIHLGIWVTNNVGSFVTTALQPQAPLWPFHLLLLLVAVYIYRLGPWALAGFAQLLSGILILVLLFGLFSLIGHVHPEFLRPVLGEGWRPVWTGAYLVLGFPFWETVIVTGWVLRWVRERDHLFRRMAVSYGGGAVYLATVIVLTLMVFGAELTAELSYPLYNLFQEVHVIDLRIEGLALFAWLVSVQVKATLCYAFALDGIHTLLRTEKSRLLTVPLAILFVIVADYVYPTTAHLKQVNIYSPLYTMVFGFVLPLLLFIVLHLRRRFSASFAKQLNR